MLQALPDLDLGPSFEAGLQAMTTSRDAFLAVPNEVFQSIFQYLSIQTLLAVSTVSRRFHEFALTEGVARSRGIDHELYLDNNNPALSMLLSAQFEVKIPFLHYTFSHLKSDKRLQSEVGKLRRVLGRRSQMRHPIGQVVLEFSKINTLLLNQIPEVEYDQESPTCAEMFEDLFDDVIAVSGMFAIRAGNLEDTPTEASSSHRHRRRHWHTHRDDEEQQQGQMTLFRPSKLSLHGCLHTVHPKAFVTFMRSVFSLCMHPHSDHCSDATGASNMPIPLIRSPSRPATTSGAIVLRTLTSFSIQSSSMLFHQPLLSWTIRSLRHPSAKAVTFSHISLSAPNWTMVLPKISIPQVESLVIDACDIRSLDLCVFLERHKDTLTRLVFLPDTSTSEGSTYPIPNQASRALASLALPKLVYLRAPLAHLQRIFPTASSSETIQSDSSRQRFPHLREISLAVDIPSADPSVNMDNISHTISLIRSAFVSSHDVDNNAPSSSPSSQRLIPLICVFLTLENPRTAMQWLTLHDSLVHAGRRSRSLSPPHIPFLHLPPSPPPVHHPASPSIGLNMPFSSPPTQLPISMLSQPPSPPSTLSRAHSPPAAPAPVYAIPGASQQHQHHIPLPPASAPSSPPLMSPVLTSFPMFPMSPSTMSPSSGTHPLAQSYTFSPSNPFSQFYPPQSDHAQGMADPSTSTLLHLVTLLTLRTELYCIPDTAWDLLPGWIASAFGPHNALSRIEFMDSGQAMHGDELDNNTSSDPTSPRNPQSPHHHMNRPSLAATHAKSSSSGHIQFMIRPENQSRVVAALKHVCKRLEKVKIGEMERSVPAWDGVLDVEADDLGALVGVGASGLGLKFR